VAGQLTGFSWPLAVLIALSPWLHVLARNLVC
jgi:hypothetical protein